MLRFTVLVSFVSTVMGSTSCSFLGVKNITTNLCECDSGFTGSQCDKLNQIPVPEFPNPYKIGIAAPGLAVWDGNLLTPLKKGSVEYLAVTSTFPNEKGGACWAYDSSGGIWIYNILTKEAKFIGLLGFGNLPGYNKNNAPWLHNVTPSIEPRIDGSTIKYALRIDAIFKTKVGNSQVSQAILSKPNRSFCSNTNIQRFPTDKYTQGVLVGYKELTATKYEDLLEEVRVILTNNTWVNNVNGANRSFYINTAFNWVPLQQKISHYYINSVNPRPLVNSQNNFGAIFTGKDGNFYKLYSHRFVPPKTRQNSHPRESVAILSIPADKYIWNDGAMYLTAQEVRLQWHIEDQFFFVNKHGFHLVLHDSRTCGQNLHDVCGSIMHFPLNSNQADILNPSAVKYWTTPTQFYNGTIIGLKTRCIKRQRPGIYWLLNCKDNNKTANTLPNLPFDCEKDNKMPNNASLVLFNGVVFKSSPSQPSDLGASSYYPAFAV